MSVPQRQKSFALARKKEFPEVQKLLKNEKKKEKKQPKKQNNTLKMFSLNFFIEKD